MTATAATHASGSGALEGRKPVDLDPALGSVSTRHPPVETVLVLLVAYAVASKVEFEIGAGYAVPTELLLGHHQRANRRRQTWCICP